MHQGFEPFIHQDEQLALLEAWRGPQALRTWLKIDTGMRRLGFPPGQAAHAIARLRACRFVAQPFGVATHLADAERADGLATRAQLAAFAAATAGLSCERSIANSAGLIAWPETRADWVRPGIMLYGISPFAGQTGTDHGLRPVMSLETRIIALRDLAPGDRVGYGGAWTAPRASRIAVAAVGYGDGYPRHCSTGTPVLVDGVRTRMVGRVSMDMITVDLTPVPEAGIGAEVTLWGRSSRGTLLPIDEVAQAGGTVGYELMCAVAPRVPVDAD